jgi:hypothetical protein
VRGVDAGRLNIVCVWCDVVDKALVVKVLVAKESVGKSLVLKAKLTRFLGLTVKGIFLS